MASDIRTEGGMLQRIGGGVLLAGIGLAAALGAAGSARADLVVAQQPCVVSGQQYCVNFGTGGTIPTIRTVSFNATAVGKAVVTFHGALTCVNPTVTKGRLHFLSQIVAGVTGTPSPALPGGLIHIGTLPPNGEAAFNLASTRVFAIGAIGRRGYSFQLQRVALSPPGTQCRVYNAAFTIQFER
jgi:hypothetical protein